MVENIPAPAPVTGQQKAGVRKRGRESFHIDDSEKTPDPFFCFTRGGFGLFAQGLENLVSIKEHSVERGD